MVIVTSLLCPRGFVLKSAIVSISLSIVGIFAFSIRVVTELDYSR